MEDCEELKKLKEYLKSKNIPYTTPNTDGDYPINRVKFNIGINNFSVINGYGTYGGFDAVYKENQGLLEIMINDNNVIGCLTCESVINIINTYL